MFKKCKNHGTIALSYPLFLLMIHHKKRGLNLTLTLIRGVRKCNSTKPMFTSTVLLSSDDSKQLVTAWAKHLSATEGSS